MLSIVATNALTSVNMNGFKISNFTEKKMQITWYKFDSKLFFENHVSGLCKKANQKLHALTRTVNYMNLSKRKALLKDLI